MKFYKVTNEDECHSGMKYRTGLNEDVLTFYPHGDCEPGGIYFAREDILAFIGYGPWIREVTLPEGEEVYENPSQPGEPKKWKAHRVILGKRRKIDAEVVRELLAEGADPKAYSSHALRWAAAHGHAKIVRILLKAGADPKAVYSSALRLAAEYGYIETFRLLLTAGADPKALDSYALYWAAYAGHTEIVRILLEAGADPKAGDSKALRWASENGHTETVEVLEDWIKNHP